MVNENTVPDGLYRQVLKIDKFRPCATVNENTVRQSSECPLTMEYGKLVLAEQYLH